MWPKDISAYGYWVDDTMILVSVITVAVAILSFVIIVYSLIAFRQSRNMRATRRLGAISKLVYLDVVLLVLDIVIVSFSSIGWSHVIQGRNELIKEHKNYVETRVIGRQFFWSFVYPGLDRKFGTNDDFTLGNYLVVPVDTTVILTLTSGDVIHSLFIPNLRVKYDAVPGREATEWFIAKRVGDYPITCTQLCGSGHFMMQARLKVVKKDEYERFLNNYRAWLEEQNSKSEYTAYGEYNHN
jgi:cytochrome c oxidase subunit 2